MRHPGAFPSRIAPLGGRVWHLGGSCISGGYIFPPEGKPESCKTVQASKRLPGNSSTQVQVQKRHGGQHYRAKHQGAPKTIHRRAKRAPRLPYEFLRRRSTDVEERARPAQNILQGSYLVPLESWYHSWYHTYSCGGYHTQRTSPYFLVGEVHHAALLS